MEHPKRTLVKTLTWRLIAVLTTIGVVYLYYGNAKESIVVGGVANLFKMVLYYVHERIWNRVHFGRQKPPEYQI